MNIVAGLTVAAPFWLVAFLATAIGTAILMGIRITQSLQRTETAYEYIATVISVMARQQ